MPDNIITNHRIFLAVIFISINNDKTMGGLGNVRNGGSWNEVSR